MNPVRAAFAGELFKVGRRFTCQSVISCKQDVELVDHGDDAGHVVVGEVASKFGELRDTGPFHGVGTPVHLLTQRGKHRVSILAIGFDTTARTWGTQVSSRGDGVNSVNETPSLKSRRYMASSDGP